MGQGWPTRKRSVCIQYSAIQRHAVLRDVHRWPEVAAPPLAAAPFPRATGRVNILELLRKSRQRATGAHSSAGTFADASSRPAIVEPSSEAAFAAARAAAAAAAFSSAASRCTDCWMRTGTACPGFFLRLWVCPVGRFDGMVVAQQCRQRDAGFRPQLN